MKKYKKKAAHNNREHEEPLYASARCQAPHASRDVVVHIKTEMDKTNFDTKITVKQAYLSMFEYLDNWWTENGQPDAVGDLLSQLQLWDSDDGKKPIDAAIFPQWIKCITKVLDEEDSPDGYQNAYINLTK